MSKLDNALDRMDRAYNRLKPNQGRQGRSNARAKFLAALRDARKALDEEYPNIPKERKRRRKPKHPSHYGWERIGSGTRDRLVRRGVDQRRFRLAAFHPYTKKTDPKKCFWTESWIRRAVDKDVSVELIVAASKNSKKRKQLDAMIRLGGRR